jgi:mannitol-1-phosphate 5-dehydrogenase
MNALMYGAGNIGRGFIGPLFAKAGYKVTFVDVAEKIVNALKEKGTYPVRILSDDETEEVWIENVCAINSANEREVTDCIAEADIMATAVGVRVLPFITPLIAHGLQKRFLSNAAPLNIIVCENLIDADKYLEELVTKNLEACEAKHLKDKVGFVKASIGRMIPVQTPEMKEENILRICSEKYGFLPVDKDAFIGKIPEIEGMVPLPNFDFYIQRKLFIHNMGHAVCAYLGLLLDDVCISDTASRPDVLFIAQNSMLESAAALEKKFNVQLRDMIDHIRDLLCRFNNRALKDTCIRVGADIERKLGPKDRLIGAIGCCKEQGVTAAFISIGAAAALRRFVEECGLDQTEDKALAILEKTSELGKDSEEARLILDMYMKIRQGDKLEKLARYALDIGKKPGVI